MKRKKRYEAEIESYCRYCERACPLSDDTTMLCRIHGVVNAGGYCRRFAYDPMKREPAGDKPLPKLEYVEL